MKASFGTWMLFAAVVVCFQVENGVVFAAQSNEKKSDALEKEARLEDVVADIFTALQPFKRIQAIAQIGAWKTTEDLQKGMQAHSGQNAIQMISSIATDTNENLLVRAAAVDTLGEFMRRHLEDASVLPALSKMMISETETAQLKRKIVDVLKRNLDPKNILTMTALKNIAESYDKITDKITKSIVVEVLSAPQIPSDFFEQNKKAFTAIREDVSNICTPSKLDSLSQEDLALLGSLVTVLLNCSKQGGWGKGETALVERMGPLVIKPMVPGEIRINILKFSAAIFDMNNMPPSAEHLKRLRDVIGAKLEDVSVSLIQEAAKSLMKANLDAKDPEVQKENLKVVMDRFNVQDNNTAAIQESLLDVILDYYMQNHRGLEGKLMGPDGKLVAAYVGPRKVSAVEVEYSIASSLFKKIQKKENGEKKLSEKYVPQILMCIIFMDKETKYTEPKDKDEDGLFKALLQDLFDRLTPDKAGKMDRKMHVAVSVAGKDGTLDIDVLDDLINVLVYPHSPVGNTPAGALEWWEKNKTKTPKEILTGK